MGTSSHVIVAFLLLVCLNVNGWAAIRVDAKSPAPTGSRSGNAAFDIRVHKTGNVYFSISNYGILGNQGDPSLLDPETGLPAPSCEFPAGSGLEYLYQGAIWIGAIVNGDTLVSTGHDGWQHIFEFFPDAWPQGSIIKRSNRPQDPAYDPAAYSETDFIAVYADTLSDPAYAVPNPDDGRPHLPLGVQITQESYSWSRTEYEEFILMRFTIENIRTHVLNGLRVGFLFDTDIWHHAAPNGFTDDLTGSLRIASQFSADSLLVAWSADNDGDPDDGLWTPYSPRAAFSTVMLETPPGSAQSFNWWVSNGDALLDWGPTLASNLRPLGTGGLGTPAGDRNKYFFMGNGERDYDQLWSAIDLSAAGWMLPPTPVLAANLADGTDTRYLHSLTFGDLAPGTRVTFGLAVIMDPLLHAQPDDFATLFDALNPQPFYNSLNFDALKTNVATAETLYRCLFGPSPGDVDLSCQVGISDIVFLVNYLFAGGTTPQDRNRADVNTDCRINLADAVYLVNYVFLGGAAPLEGCIE